MRSLWFYSMKPVSDLFDALMRQSWEGVSEGEKLAKVKELVRSMAQHQVASFEGKSVIGYFKGRRAVIDLQVRT